MKILHIDSSISGASSVSRQLTRSIVAQLTALTPGAVVQYLDLAANPLPQLGPDLLAAKMAGGEGADVAASAAALAGFMAADVVVIGAPMYNFSVPSQLKAWIDSIAVAGVTFSYSATGAQGLCGGKRVIIASARGSVFTAPSPNAALDHQENYLRGLFGFLGVEQVDVVRAEGVAYGPEPRRQALDGALADVTALAA
jgi:FMN-dependent NADH-azoreductase